MKNESPFFMIINLCFVMMLFGVHVKTVSADLIWPIPEFPSDPDVTPEPKFPELDYLVLVNKQNPVPENWVHKFELVHMINSREDDVAAEVRTYDAYLALKDALSEEDVFVDLDSGYRSIEEQQQIMEDFTEGYGEDYANQFVAVPGYSEHHTGLALDLYFIIDGVDVFMNEDIVQYPEIWAKIHEKLADFGFILRYPEGKEEITGYSYEPWHIRYLNDPETAREIMENGLTLEEYLNR
jgi:D-alanyl-D-alanine carboxypeptidase